MLISVIIPTFNRERTIRASVMSVLNQTYSNIELIIIDDNSTDNTREVIESIKDNRIQYIKLDENYGACYARNIGIDFSKGKYIAFHDSDDLWLPNKLEVQVKYLQESNADIVSCSFLNISSNGQAEIPFKRSNSDVLFDDIIKENYVSTQTILGKRECFENERFDVNLPRFQDWELVLRLCKKYKFRFQNESLAEVYLQEDSISKNNNNAIIALRYIIEKNQRYFDKNKSLLCFYYRRMADFAIKDNQSPYSFYCEAIKLQPFNIKNIYKLLTVFRQMRNNYDNY